MDSKSNRKSTERLAAVEQALARARYVEIAERAGYTRQHAAGVINGTRSFTTKSLRKIADAAGVSEEELLEYRRRSQA